MNTKGFSINFFLCMFLTSNSAIQAVNPDGWWASILKTIFRLKEMAPENEALYRGLLKDAGVKNTDSFIIGTWPKSENGGISPIGPTLIIDEEYFSSLPLAQKMALIGHEATHIKNKHVEQHAMLHLALWTLQFPIQYMVERAYEKIKQSTKNERLKRFFSSNATRFTVHGLTFVLTYLLPMVAMSWHNEFEADREGAKALDCAQGMVTLFQKFDAEYTNKMETASLFGAAKLIFRRHFLGRLSHPPLSWRIAEVEKLV